MVDRLINVLIFLLLVLGMPVILVGYGMYFRWIWRQLDEASMSYKEGTE